MANIMKKDNRQKSQKDHLVLALIVYLLAGILLLKYYRYQINPDGVCYISIAQKYLAGNFHDAINRSWYPLFSWLLVPLLFLKVEPLLATKVLNLIIGLPIILVMYRLSRQFSLSVWTRRVILFSLIPIVLSMCSFARPDLLLTCPLLVYFYIIFQPSYPGTIKQGVLCGLWGSLAYFAKSYAFPFFVSHFLLMNVLHYFRHDSREEKNRILINCCCGFVVFGIISGAWIAVMSAKYHELTFSYGSQIMRVKNPEYQSIVVRPTGFESPPNPTAIGLNEDPSLSNCQIAPWSPFDSFDAMKHYIVTVMRQATRILYNFQLFSCLSIAVCLTYVLFLLQRPRKILTECEVLYPFVSLLLYCAGYSLTHVQTRYLWLTCFLLLLMGGYTLERLFQNNFFTKTRKTALYVFFIASFTFTPIVRLPSYLNRGKSIYLLSQKFKNHIRPGHRIASNTEWTHTLYLAYHLDARYYSTAKANISEQDLEDELRKFSIHHYLVWGEPVESLRPLSGYQQVDIDGIIEPKLYSLVTRDYKQ